MAASSIPVPSCAYRVPCNELASLKMVNSSATSTLNHAIFAVINGVSVVVGLLAAVLMLCLNLYKTIVYRLAVYQILSALAIALVGAMQVVFINYDESPNMYGRICTAIGLLQLYTKWTKLFFTM